MTPLAAALAPGSDTGLSNDARLLYQERLRGLFESPSVGALWLKDLLSRMQAVAQMASTDDWDGDGGLAVEQSTLRYATRFVLGLPQGLAPSSVLVDRDGDITFDWGLLPTRTFSVSVSRDGTLTYAGFFDGAQTWGHEATAERTPASFLVNIDRTSR
jgi:hypothetical protein